MEVVLVYMSLRHGKKGDALFPGLYQTIQARVANFITMVAKMDTSQTQDSIDSVRIQRHCSPFGNEPVQGDQEPQPRQDKEPGMSPSVRFCDLILHAAVKRSQVSDSTCLVGLAYYFSSSFLLSVCDSLLW